MKWQQTKFFLSPAIIGKHASTEEVKKIFATTSSDVNTANLVICLPKFDYLYI